MQAEENIVLFYKDYIRVILRGHLAGSGFCAYLEDVGGRKRRVLASVEIVRPALYFKGVTWTRGS